MTKFGEKLSISLIFSLFILDIVIGTPMFYKKNENDKYEPDLIAVSSTVIPLTVFQVSNGGDSNGKFLNDEYKMAYLKHMHKKAHLYSHEDPSTLITLKKKYHGHNEEKASVKSTSSQHD